MTLPPRRRTQPIRVALYVTDCALRADIADACGDAGMAVAAPPPYPPPQAGEGISIYPPPLAGEGEDVEGADVVLADRPVGTTVPVIALASGEAREDWPADVRAVVPADADAATITAVITVVAAGYTLAPRKSAGEDTGKASRKNPGAWADSGQAVDELAGALTPREREVLALLAEGASNKEIARALALSIHTIKFHVASLTEKLGARSRVEAVAIAVRAGLAMV